MQSGMLFLSFGVSCDLTRQTVRTHVWFAFLPRKSRFMMPGA